MPRRPKWLYEMPPEERAAYLAKQPKKIQVEITSLERERDELARQVKAFNTPVERPGDAPITWHMRGGSIPSRQVHALPERACLTLRLDKRRILQVYHYQGRVRVGNYSAGDLIVVPGGGSNTVTLDVTDPIRQRIRLQAAMSLWGKASDMLAELRHGGANLSPEDLARFQVVADRFAVAHGLVDDERSTEAQ